jgi:hypothetical protein
MDSRIIIIIIVLLLGSCILGAGIYFFMNQNSNNASVTTAPVASSTTAPGATTTAPAKSESLDPNDPCFGLTDSTPASQISLSCLQKTWKDAGCKESGAYYPKDVLGWWSQDKGAGTYRVVKNDMKAYTSQEHINHCIGT